MEWPQLIAVLLSGLIGVSLGLLGGGGSILAVPVLVYVAGIEAKTSVAMSLAIVGATSLAASALHWRQGRLDLRTAALFGSAGTVGALLGAQLTPLVSSGMLLLLFALLMFVVAALMLRNQTTADEATPHTANLPRTLLAGFGVGIVTGFLGVGGGFLIVPALVLFGGLSMHMAVGTSLLVIALNSAAGFIGHWQHSTLPLNATLAFTAAAISGTFIGAWLSRRISAQRLRHSFAVFVMVVALGLLIANRHALL